MFSSVIAWIMQNQKSGDVTKVARNLQGLPAAG
jgi:hypothetical protein